MVVEAALNKKKDVSDVGNFPIQSLTVTQAQFTALQGDSTK